MRKLFFDSLLEKAKKDKKIILLTADVGYGVMDNFRKELPEQFFNVGISEQLMVSMACGLSYEGFRPYIASNPSFLVLKCLEQIKLDILFNKSNVKLVGLGNGKEDMDITHICPEDSDLLKSIGYPYNRIFSPVKKDDVNSIIELLVNSDETAYVRLSRTKYETAIN